MIRICGESFKEMLTLHEWFMNFPFPNRKGNEINYQLFDEVHEFNGHVKMLMDGHGQSTCRIDEMKLL
jgi:hypothetical protein